MKGYIGRYVKIDLSTGSVEEIPLTAKMARKYIGGNGFAASIIHEMVRPDVDPLSENNAIVFATGPLNESGVWGTARGHVASISPLTGLFGDSNFGGDAASAMKRSGFDAVVIIGKSEKPVYILIDNGQVMIKDAWPLWEKFTSETQSLIAYREGKGVETCCIGPAGENGIKFANIMCSGRRPSAAGRCGAGAVMGSKNLKAVSFRGEAKIEVANGSGLKTLLRERADILRNNTHALHNMGTTFLINMLNSRGMLSTHNNTKETFEHAYDISGDRISEEFMGKNIACHKCPVACGKTVHVPEGEFAGSDVKMPEFETLYAFGSMLDNGNLVSIFNANAMCDEMGIDTMSMGVTIAFLAECFEKGLVTEKEIGQTVSFGSDTDIAEIVRLTALRRGIGELLSLGSQKISEKIGKGSEKFLYAVKGLDIAGHSARAGRSMGLAYATSTRGGSHHDARPKYPENDEGMGPHQAEYCVNSQNYTALGDSLVMCRFVMERGFAARLEQPLVDVVNMVTGWDVTIDELRKTGERIYTLERLINTQRGITRKDDTLPWRVMNEPIPDGPCKGRYCPKDELDPMLDRYYELRGWDSNGIPTADKLKELGLI